MFYAFIKLLAGTAGRGIPLVIFILQTGGRGFASARNWIPGSSCLFHFAGRRTYGRRAPPAELTICTTLLEHIKEKRLSPPQLFLICQV